MSDRIVMADILEHFRLA